MPAASTPEEAHEHWQHRTRGTNIHEKLILQKFHDNSAKLVGLSSSDLQVSARSQLTEPVPHVDRLVDAHGIENLYIRDSVMEYAITKLFTMTEAIVPLELWPSL